MNPLRSRTTLPTSAEAGQAAPRPGPLSVDGSERGDVRSVLAAARRAPAYAALLIAAFCAGFSLPLARVALLATLVLTLRDVAKGTRAWRFPVTGWAWGTYVLIALVTTGVIAATTSDPLIVPCKGLGKLDKLLWFLAIPLTPTLVDSRGRFLLIAKAFALGAGVGALDTLVVNTAGAWVQVTLPMPGDAVSGDGAPAYLQAVTDAVGVTGLLREWTLHHWRARTFNDALAKLGGMAAAQRLMVGLVASLGLALQARRAGERTSVRRWFALTLLLAGGLVVALKRGPWLSALLVATPMLAAGLGRRRVVLALLVGVALVLSLPAARSRLAELPTELTFDKGGRALMWKHIVPCLRRDHPWGVGFRGLTNDAMRRYTRRVELYQNHVHSNPLQILVELGWQGLVAYFVWMLLGLRDGVRLAARARASPEAWHDADALLRAIPLAMLAALILNGFVEYNFADGELVVLYGLAMGLAAVRLSGS